MKRILDILYLDPGEEWCAVRYEGLKLQVNSSVELEI